jgi:hypothetical protein
MVQNDRRPSGLRNNSIFLLSKFFTISLPNNSYIAGSSTACFFKDNLDLIGPRNFNKRKSNAQFNFDLLSDEEAMVMAKGKKVTSGQVKKNPTKSWK